MATQPIARTKPLDWPTAANAVIVLHGGEKARYVGQCSVTGKRRVQTFKDRGRPVDPPTDSGQFQNLTYTTWLLNDAGQCRGDLAPCEQDWLGQIAA